MKYKFLYILILIPLILMGCRKDYVFQNFDYTTYNRVVGPKGGTINFYANYENDANTEIVASLDVPIGALDSLMVFNMYQYEDYELATLMDDGFVKMGSKLIYFIPFYESDGYHERGQMELNYHLSVPFHKPINVTYHPLANITESSLKNWQEVELYYDFYKTTNKAYKVYRIKIPKIDEWGENNNIFVNWNRQGYANGYDPTDLSYITNGRWSAGDPWGTGEPSMVNWELVGLYNIDPANDVVSFKIEDTDYIYVIARDLFVTNIPPNISNLAIAFGLDLKRVSLDGNYYKGYLSDNSIVVFDIYGNYQYRLYENVSTASLPANARTSINSYGAQIDKITLKDSSSNLQYTVVLNSGYKLTYSGGGFLMNVNQFGYNPQNLPAAIKTYMDTHYPNESISNVIYDSYYPTYIIYLSSNIKVYFSGNVWNRTVYYRMNSDNLPKNILDYFSTNYPNDIFSEINYTIWPKGSTSIYDINMVGNKHFKFDDNGVFQEFEFDNVSEGDLPPAVKATIDRYYPYPQLTILNIIHKKIDRNGTINDYFTIYFTDGTSAYIGADGSMG